MGLSLISRLAPLVVATALLCAAPANAAITFQQAATGECTTSGATSCAITFSVAPSAGDLILLHVGIKATATMYTISTPAGYTLRTDWFNGTNWASFPFWRVAGAAEPTGLTVSLASGSLAAGDLWGVSAVVYRGVAPVSPVQASNGATVGSSSSLSIVATGASVNVGTLNLAIEQFYFPHPQQALTSQTLNGTWSFDFGGGASRFSVCNHGLSSGVQECDDTATTSPAAAWDAVSEIWSIAPPPATGGQRLPLLGVGYAPFYGRARAWL